MMLPELFKSIDIEKRGLEREEEGDLSRLGESESQMDPCSSTQFKMNMVMPRITSVMKEEDIDLVII
jgi:hypothetical protein